MINIIENQSFLDVAIQEQGSALTAFELAIKNGFSITDDLLPGDSLVLPISNLENTGVANYFKGKRQMVACGSKIGTQDLPIKPIGIGAMRIENDFIVG
ncbi:hypothetical protein [Flavobacterium sp.]|uniref:hypothetical protein n=1 Tax=Flavobacterium sp. TaxID=239 RepID=UPI0032650AA7